MAHIESQLLAAFETLVKGHTTCGNDVFKERLDPLPEKSLPAITYKVAREDVGRLTQGLVYHQRRELVIEVDIVVQLSEGYGDQARAIELELNALIASDPTLGNLANDLIVPGEMEMHYDGNGKGGLCLRRRHWTANYFCMSNALDNAD